MSDLNKAVASKKKGSLKEDCGQLEKTSSTCKNAMRNSVKAFNLRKIKRANGKLDF